MRHGGSDWWKGTFLEDFYGMLATQSFHFQAFLSFSFIFRKVSDHVHFKPFQPTHLSITLWSAAVNLQRGQEIDQILTTSILHMLEGRICLLREWTLRDAFWMRELELHGAWQWVALNGEKKKKKTPPGGWRFLAFAGTKSWLIKK